MIDTISERSKKILRIMAGSESMSRAAIEEKAQESRNNTIRELAKLTDLGYVVAHGEARATVYSITDEARSLVIWDVNEYLQIDPDKRNVQYRAIEPQLLKSIAGSVGKIDQTITDALRIRQKYGDTTATRKDLERFVIELSWKSSKIEGNTYTLLDTEVLIKDAKQAAGHPHDEAIMILNHKTAFEYVWQHQQSFRQLTLPMIEEVHQLLVDGLNVDFGIRNEPVGITGTVYNPPASKVEIQAYFHDVINTINGMAEPVEKALACLMLIAYLQPFADGNKRTSRLMANAVLIAHGYAPMSYRSVDEELYKGSLLLFYEQGTVANFRDVYLEQLKEGALNYHFPVTP